MYLSVTHKHDKCPSHSDKTLVLLQEEYTETFAGNREAGLKILVHDQIDPPLMDSLGSAIPPGFHAFIGVRRNEVSVTCYDAYTILQVD